MFSSPLKILSNWIKPQLSQLIQSQMPTNSGFLAGLFLLGKGQSIVQNPKRKSANFWREKFKKEHSNKCILSIQSMWNISTTLCIKLIPTFQNQNKLVKDNLYQNLHVFKRNFSHIIRTIVFIISFPKTFNLVLTMFFALWFTQIVIILYHSLSLKIHFHNFISKS